MDFCQIIRDIEKDPKANVKPMTVREFYALKDHVAECKECSRGAETPS